MPRYIDAYKLETATKNKIAVDHGWCKATIDEDFIDLIHDAESEDVRKIEHGEWILFPYDNADKEVAVCSVCRIGFSRIAKVNFYFCPRCGSEMMCDAKREFEEKYTAIKSDRPFEPV